MCQDLVTMLPERLALPFRALDLPPPSAFVVVLTLHRAPSTLCGTPLTLISTLGREKKTVLRPNSNAPMGRQGIYRPAYFLFPSRFTCTDQSRSWYPLGPYSFLTCALLSFSFPFIKNRFPPHIIYTDYSCPPLLPVPPLPSRFTPFLSVIRKQTYNR